MTKFCDHCGNPTKSGLYCGKCRDIIDEKRAKEWNYFAKSMRSQGKDPHMVSMQINNDIFHTFLSPFIFWFSFFSTDDEFTWTQLIIAIVCWQIIYQPLSFLNKKYFESTNLILYILNSSAILYFIIWIFRNAN